MLEKKFSPIHHANLFGYIAEDIISSLDQVGINALKQAVRRYGKERGQRMAQRAILHGDELSMENFLAYGEWIPGSEPMVSNVVKTTPKLITHVQRCPWVDAWNQENLLEFGRIYCTEIDEALVDGFNPDLTLKIHSTLSFGDKFCEFEYCNIALTPTVQQFVDEKKAQLGKSKIKSWEYHTAHLYYTLLNDLKKKCGEDGKTAVIHALTRFGKKFGQDFRNTLLLYNNIDFTSIHYPTTKITIIGFGNLMQSLFPGIREFVGQENISTHINATTADQDINTRKELEKEFGIKLYFRNNLLEDSFIYYDSAKVIYESINLRKELHFTYAKLGWICIDLLKCQFALDYYKLAYDLCEEVNMPIEYCASFELPMRNITRMIENGECK